MRILIAGGFGFVGGRVAQQLQQLGHQVVLGSRDALGPPCWLSGAEVVKTDWNDACALVQICHGADVVIQAAGMNAQDCVADPVAALEFNGLATARLCAAAVRAGVKRFVCLSSAHVYASPLAGTITESTCPSNLHPYATSHLAGENSVLSASQFERIEGVVLRLSNAFGAPAHKNVNCWMLLVNDLCRQAVETGKMVLLSSGLQQRDFISLAEVCRIVGQLSTRDFDMPLPNVFNVGSGVSQSVLEMAQLVQQRCSLILGFEPELLRSERAFNEKHEMLTFRTGRLDQIGLSVGLDNRAEIDSLLAFCRASYSQS